jgi:hypothetical protein
MGENLNLSNVFLTSFFIFGAVLAAKFEKSTNMTQKNFSNQKRCQETQNFMLISCPLKKF